MSRFDASNFKQLNSVNAQLADIMTNIKNLGVYCDNLHDNAPTINQAISNGATFILLPRNTKINSPINATNRNDKPLKFIGLGWSQNGGAGSIVYANTSGVAFDCTSFQFVTFEDMLIYSDANMSNPLQ